MSNVSITHGNLYTIPLTFNVIHVTLSWLACEICGSSLGIAQHYIPLGYERVYMPIHPFLSKAKRTNYKAWYFRNYIVCPTVEDSPKWKLARCWLLIQLSSDGHDIL